MENVCVTWDTASTQFTTSAARVHHLASAHHWVYLVAALAQPIRLPQLMGNNVYVLRGTL